MNELRPLVDWPASGRRRIRGVLADIDDTRTTGGRVSAAVYDAMERLRAQGLLMVPITGRPGGWCDMIARTWPVDGIVGENGALAFRYDEPARRMTRLYADPPEVRAANRVRLETVRADILAAVPGVAVAADQAYRETDLAIDFAEDVRGVPEAAVDAVVDVFERHGATAKVSSIHVNGWFGSYDKLTMTERFLRECFAIDLDAEVERFVFVGDSPNDSPMFGHFPNAVGVANLKDMRERCLGAARPRLHRTGGSPARRPLRGSPR
jgi:HAD superfamily hydrolase (TIGR01484 family)